MERVGFAGRALAAVIDTALLLIIALPIIYFGLASIFGPLDLKAPMPGEIGALVRPVSASAILLYSLVELFKGASPGGMMLKIQIRQLNGEPAEFRTLFIRWAVKNLNSALKLLGALLGIAVIIHLGQICGVIFMVIGSLFVFGKERQTLCDMIAKTSVYRR